MGVLRFLFAIAVVFAHSPWNAGMVFVGPRNAVQLFYMTSGFLISFVLTERNAQLGKAVFYKSRWLRIYPMYFFVALLTLIIYWFLNPSFFDLYRSLPVSATMFLAIVNVVLLGQDWVMFSAIENGTLIASSNFSLSEYLLWQGLLVPQAWSLGLELCFYAIAPFICPKKYLLICLLLLSLAVRAFLFFVGIGNNDPWTYRFFPAELTFFLAGTLSHQLILPLWRRYSNKYLSFFSITGTTAFIFYVITYFLIPLPGFLKAPILFFCFFITLPLTFVFQNTYRWDRIIGELSYPIYLGHFIMIFLVEFFSSRWNMHDIFYISITNVGASIIFAIFLNQFIGIPIDRFRHKSKRYSA